jgi:HEAT repeat protein
VLALSFAGANDDIQRLHSILEEEGDDEKLAHACVIGLEILQDNSERGVELVAKLLEAERQHHSATSMLSAAGTPAAWRALWNNLKTDFDHITALNLINLSEHSTDVAEFAVEKLPTTSHFGNWDFLRTLICNVRKPELKAKLLEDRWLRDTLHRESVAAEGNSWISGRKSTAIECLAEFDREAAFVATRRALESTDGHDRERYPYLLREVNVERAVPILLDRLAAERSGHVRFAIGRALSNLDLEMELRARMAAPTETLRAAACFAAGWVRDGEKLKSDLHAALNDPSELVIR